MKRMKDLIGAFEKPIKQLLCILWLLKASNKTCSTNNATVECILTSHALLHTNTYD